MVGQRFGWHPLELEHTTIQVDRLNCRSPRQIA